MLPHIFSSILILQRLQKLGKALNHTLMSRGRHHSCKYKLFCYFLLGFDEVNELIQLVNIWDLIDKSFSPLNENSSYCFSLIKSSILALQSLDFAVELRRLRTYQFDHIIFKVIFKVIGFIYYKFQIIHQSLSIQTVRICIAFRIEVLEDVRSV